METFDTDITLLERLGLVKFYNADSGDLYYRLDPLLVALWPTTHSICIRRRSFGRDKIPEIPGTQIPGKFRGHIT